MIYLPETVLQNKPEQKTETIVAPKPEASPTLVVEDKGMRTFVVIGEDGTESGGYKGRSPRQAALKVINRSDGTKEKPVVVKLRERGTKKVHIFKGYTQMIKTPEKRPAWMHASVKKPFAEKIGTEKAEKKKEEKEKGE